MKNLDQITYSSVFALGIGGLCLGGSVVSGVFTGAISTLGVALILLKIRDGSPRLFNWIIRHNIMTDIFLSVILVYLMGTTTVTALISGASAALFCSAGITYLGKIMNKETTSGIVCS